MIFHITEQSIWSAAQSSGDYRAPSLETEGFIHLSERSQVLWVASQFYAQTSGLLLLGIEPAQLAAELRYDTVPGHGTFPHLYGPLNLDAVVQVWPFEPQANGHFVMPS
ncbi:DUF952 domain-containing protein [filamentous cyanobacterium LEGE 11480]|uniref:DUF952 domain-containing protein n=1 Tax=Romeriopsis navalis LEGE 11480 TaxID=2777977 RepID=A0A928VIT5_9CYAN|nr:DUF952 domain-containing protein [Romeriopsis navalis]MBE9028538.1 DUF952 domain-containing protein [Romeriopsis navalis LEGE 11480]